MNLRGHGRSVTPDGCKPTPRVLQGARRFVCKKIPLFDPRLRVSGSSTLTAKVCYLEGVNVPLSQSYGAIPIDSGVGENLQDCKDLRAKGLQETPGRILAGGAA